MASLVRDTFWGGALTCYQPQRGSGYRFNLDSVALAYFVQGGRRCLELGAGCGIISLLCLGLGKAGSVVAVEYQQALFAALSQNAQANGYSAQLQPICGDLRQLALPEADYCLFNPPYFALKQGRLPARLGERLARFEVLATLADFVAAAVRATTPQGGIGCIIPSTRLPALSAAFARFGVAVGRLRPVVTNAGDSPRYYLVEGWKGAAAPAADCQQLAPLVLHDPSGAYSAEVQSWLRLPADFSCFKGAAGLRPAGS